MHLTVYMLCWRGHECERALTVMVKQLPVCVLKQWPGGYLKDAALCFEPLA